jgi:hypothetical protein
VVERQATIEQSSHGGGGSGVRSHGSHMLVSLTTLAPEVEEGTEHRPVQPV